MIGNKIKEIKEELIKEYDLIKNKIKEIFNDTFNEVLDINNYEFNYEFSCSKFSIGGIPDLLVISYKDGGIYRKKMIVIDFINHEITYNLDDIKSTNTCIFNCAQKFNDIIMREDNKEIKKEKYGYIYRIVCRDNNKSYIGKHKAKEFDIYYKGSGIALYDKYISLGIAKTHKGKVDRDGFDKHFYIELIDWAYSEDELNELETKYIDEYDTLNNGYNIAEGGNGGNNKNTVKKSVLCLDKQGVLIKEYNSISETKQDGFDPSLVGKVCRGIRNTHGGYYWKYKE